MCGLKPRVCSREGCGAKATHLAGLILKAAYGGGMQSLLDLPVCPGHARTLKVADVVSDAGWEQISATVEAAGKMPPLRGRTQIYTCPIDEAPAMFRDLYEN
jgi:hypothetical protein